MLMVVTEVKLGEIYIKATEIDIEANHWLLGIKNLYFKYLYASESNAYLERSLVISFA